MNKILLVVFLLLGGQLLNAQVKYYVSTKGDDANSGTKRHPVATLERAQQWVREIKKDGMPEGGVEVILQEGTYHINKTLVFTTEDSGTKEAPVVFRAAENEHVVISGGRKLNGWETTDGRIYQLHLPKKSGEEWNIRHLFIDGKRVVRARTPNVNAPDKYITMLNSVREKVEDGNEQIEYNYDWITGINDPGNQWSVDDRFTVTVDPRWTNDWENLPDAELVALTNWATTHKKIKRVMPHKGEVILQPPHVKYFGYNAPKKGWPCYFENALEFLDTANEWYFDRAKGILYCIPSTGVDLNQMEVVVPVIQALVEGKGTRREPLTNFTFEGITFAYSEWLRPPTGLNGRQGCYDYWGDDEETYMGSALDFEFAENIRFTRCEFTCMGGGGIAFRKGTRNIDLTGNVFHDISGNGISVGEELRGPLVPEEVQITNNLFFNCAAEYFGGNAVFVSIARYIRIAHNCIHDLPYSGIATGWWWPDMHYPYEKWKSYSDSIDCAGYITIEYNHICNTMLEVSDGGGIYTLGPQPHSIIRYNHIHGIRSNSVPNSNYESQPIFFDGRTAGFTVEGNVTYDYHAGAYRRNQPTKDEDYIWINNHFTITEKDSLQYFEAFQKAGLEKKWRKLLKMKGQ
ncbi:MAG: right-handed parallel beta-helix repeat-containing protein [Marinilabiliaceae bacterium]|nr:right-handed parallel beta-helix repeat-containing protein [Marinilabiliaceae bacterium]